MNVCLLFVKVMNTSGIIAWSYKSFPLPLTRYAVLLSLYSSFLHLSYANLTLYLYKFLCFWFCSTSCFHLHVVTCTSHSYFLSQYLTNLIHKICFAISFISCLYMFRAHVLIIRRSKLYNHTYRCDDIRGCVIQYN